MEGKVVEWMAQPSGIRTGIVDNVPPVRRVGLVFAVRGEFASVVPADAFDAYSRSVVPVAKLTVLGEARPGWGLTVAEGGYV